MASESLCPSAARENGGCKKDTDVPLLPVPSSKTFNDKVENLIDMLANDNMEMISSVLNFAVTIFGMRHPKELRDLVYNFTSKLCNVLKMEPLMDRLVRLMPRKYRTSSYQPKSNFLKIISAGAANIQLTLL